MHARPMSERGIPQEPDRRVRLFILLRLTLVIAASYLVLAQTDFARPSLLLAGLIVLGLASNVVLPPLSKRITRSSVILGGIILADTAWITVMLIVTGNFHADFFYLYFFVLFIAAIGENLALIIVGAVIACSAYYLALAATGRGPQLMTTAILIRMPFMLSVAVFYGYLADRVRREESRARAEAVIISELDASRRSLAAANALLQAEIEERKRIEEELHKISDMKSAFVSTVSHELRTPLTAIRNAVDLLKTVRDDDAAFEKFTAMALRNVERLTCIVSDLLDLTKIEAGRLTLTFSKIDLEHLLRGVLENFEPQARKAQLELTFELGETLPQVWADPGRVEQVMTNLVGNAIKFTPPGGHVSVEASRATGHGGNGDATLGERQLQDIEAGVDSAERWIEVSVTDSGRGLAHDELTRIFEPFYQVGDALTNRAQGTGLGLAISRDLVRAHGSDIVVTSRPGAGSRFSFMLPVDGPAAHEVTDLETRMREFQAYPFFSVLVVFLRAGTKLAPEQRQRWVDLLAHTVGDALPRSSDVVIPQPAHGRLVIVLLGTQSAGAEIVRVRLGRHITSIGASHDMGRATAQISSVASYPEDGETGAQLIRVALTPRKEE